MTNSNHGRLVVEVGDKWRFYTNTIPAGAEVIGTVSRDGMADIGALVRFANGNYVQINAGELRSLDGRKVSAALGTAGRPAELEGGRKVNTYLDAESIAIAQRLGNGNISEGIRTALRMANQTSNA